MTVAARQDGERNPDDPSAPLPAAPRHAGTAQDGPSTAAPGVADGLRRRPVRRVRRVGRTALTLWGAAALAQVAAVGMLLQTGTSKVPTVPAVGAAPGVDVGAAPPADGLADAGQGRVVTSQPVVLGAAPPVALMIPALKINTRLLGVRKDRQGRMQVPGDPQRAAWYSQGPAPGDPGPAVLVGHVDSYTGPGIFVGLGSLHKGDKIYVRRSDGTTAAFRVSAVDMYAKRNFPTELVYRGDGTPSLRLITCGGTFDHKAKSYLQNIVVFAAAEPAAPTTSAPAAPTAPTQRLAATTTAATAAGRHS